MRFKFILFLLLSTLLLASCSSYFLKELVSQKTLVVDPEIYKNPVIIHEDTVLAYCSACGECVPEEIDCESRCAQYVAGRKPWYERNPKPRGKFCEYQCKNNKHYFTLNVGCKKREIVWVKFDDLYPKPDFQNEDPSIQNEREFIFYEPPPYTPYEISPYLKNAWCEKCGECVPLYIDHECFKESQHCDEQCETTFRCLMTESEFNMLSLYCDTIIWISRNFGDNIGSYILSDNPLQADSTSE